MKAFNDYVFISLKLIAYRICVFVSFRGQNLLKPRPGDLACMLSRCMIKNGESCEIPCGFFTAMAGNKAVKQNWGSSVHFYALS